MGMTIQKLHKKIKDKLVSINWNKSWKEESDSLEKLSMLRARYPLDPVYDSFFQQKAQMLNSSLLLKIALWFTSFLATFFLIAKYLSISSGRKLKDYDVAYYYSKEIYHKDYEPNKSKVDVQLDKGTLYLRDIVFLMRCLVMVRLDFSLIAIATFRIAQARYAMARYGVSELWVSMEYSAACGILKKYGENEGLKIVNFMHGEKVLTARDSFCSFDDYYVWTDHHADVVSKLYCKSNISVLNPWEGLDLGCDFTKMSVCYFLKGGESEEELEELCIVLDSMKKNGHSIFLKEHPRRKTDSYFVNQYSVVPVSRDILEVFGDYQYIVAQYSTVLLQAWLLGREVIVDDVSNPLLFESLKDRNYIFSKSMKNTCKLSEMI
ncbi:hypothetical protein [Granulosicoccus antarcticus]|uniref:Uncharacterized protein n=1 Tax=Granulosicoccus antarcticus IMCC3135 TaxID=1192854 RepID=A0A2Z2P0E7_9GAMM|nr:hypothetical protein [Granulosicoccus antarcticus]ASJ74610.1 hypothetical protein IMCC3135_22700 [Granulosicoccus antarcticus IMCC3135]